MRSVKNHSLVPAACVLLQPESVGILRWQETTATQRDQHEEKRFENHLILLIILLLIISLIYTGHFGETQGCFRWKQIKDKQISRQKARLNKCLCRADRRESRVGTRQISAGSETPRGSGLLHLKDPSPKVHLLTRGRRRDPRSKTAGSAIEICSWRRSAGRGHGEIYR